MSGLLQTATLGDALFKVAAFALFTHYIYKRWEPTNVPFQLFLLTVVPLALSTIIATHISIFTALALTYLTYLGTLATSVALYRLSPFHPLAGYPGPLLCKLTQFFMINVSMKGKRHLYIQQLHDKYGDIVRIGPNEVSIRDVSAINPLMGTNGWPKGPNYLGRSLGPQPTEAMIMIRDTAEHHRRRRPWNRAFSTAALKEYEPLVAKRVNQLVEKIASEKQVDIAKYIGYFTYDFMGDMAFGGWYEMVRDGDKDGRWKAMEEALRATVFFEHIPWVTYWLQAFGVGAESISKQRSFAKSRADERVKQGSTTKDLFYYLNNDDGADPQQPPASQVISDGNLAIIAGSDTTASVLSNIFYFLLIDKAAYKRLQEEVDRFYPHGEDATDTRHHTKMQFLEAVINEALRLLPAVPSGSQRAAFPAGSGGKAVGPYYLPEGTHARIHFYSVQRDPRNFFPHPESFWPDRWIIAEGGVPAPKDFRHNPSAFTPFSFGPYNCVGKNLAMQEMRTVLCTFMQNLDLKFQDGYDPAEWTRDLEDMFVVSKGRLPITATRRF